MSYLNSYTMLLPCRVYHFRCATWQIMDKRKSISKKMLLNEHWWMHSALTHTVEVFCFFHSPVHRARATVNALLLIGLGKKGCYARKNTILLTYMYNLSRKMWKNCPKSSFKHKRKCEKLSVWLSFWNRACRSLQVSFCSVNVKGTIFKQES